MENISVELSAGLTVRLAYLPEQQGNKANCTGKPHSLLLSNVLRLRQLKNPKHRIYGIPPLLPQTNSLLLDLLSWPDLRIIFLNQTKLSENRLLLVSVAFSRLNKNYLTQPVMLLQENNKIGAFPLKLEIKYPACFCLISHQIQLHAISEKNS